MAFTYRNPLEVVPVGAVESVRNASSPDTVSCTFSAQGGRSYQMTLIVETDSRYVGPIQVIQSLGIHPGDIYRYPFPEIPPNVDHPPSTETDSSAFLQNVQLKQEGADGKQWTVTLSYDPIDVNHEQGDENAADWSKNPLLARPKVWWSSAKYEYHRTTDTDGNPYRNTVGDPLVDTPGAEETRPILTIVRNEATFNVSLAIEFTDKVNNADFLGYPANTVKCKSILGDREYDPDWGFYWSVKYELEVRDDTDTDGDGWTLAVLNQGYRQKVGGTGDPVDVLINGKPVSDPVPLTESGEYLPDADPYYLLFYVYKQVDFSPLNIPPDILTQTS